MADFDYIISSGNKQQMIKKNKIFLVDKLHNVNNGDQVEIECYFDGKYCKKKIKVQVHESIVAGKKIYINKRKCRAHHTTGIQGYRHKYTALICGGK